MGIEREREFLHSWYVLIITVFTLVFLLINKVLWINVLLVVGTLYIFFNNGLSLFKIFKIFSYAFFFSFGIFLLSVLNPGKTGTVDKALATMIKLFIVSFVSISSASAIDYTKVVLHLIVHKGLRLIWGYPFLLAMNSVALFKEEYDRIKLNARLRGLPWKDRVFVFFPLLVFAVRHSQRGALSLVTRGLNDRKTFYFSYDTTSTDKKRLFLFWLFYFGLVVAAQIKLR